MLIKKGQCTDSIYDIDIPDSFTDIKSLKSYSRNYCIEVCYWKRISHACNCSVPIYYERENFEQCSKSSNYTCILDEMAKNLPFKKRVCMKKCRSECSKISYPVTFEKSPLKKTNNKINLNFFFESFKIESIKQIPKIETIEFLLIILSSLGSFLGINLYNIFRFLNEKYIYIKNFLKKTSSSTDSCKTVTNHNL